MTKNINPYSVNKTDSDWVVGLLSTILVILLIGILVFASKTISLVNNLFMQTSETTGTQEINKTKIKNRSFYPDRALTKKEIEEGFVVNNNGFLAWRWLDADESEVYYCYEGVTCNFVRVTALDDCELATVTMNLMLEEDSEVLETQTVHIYSGTGPNEMSFNDSVVVEVDFAAQIDSTYWNQIDHVWCLPAG